MSRENIRLGTENILWYEDLDRDELKAVLASEHMEWDPESRNLRVFIDDARVFSASMMDYVHSVDLREPDAREFLSIRGLDDSEIDFYLNSAMTSPVSIDEIRTEAHWNVKAVDDYAKKTYNDYMKETGINTQLSKVSKKKKSLDNTAKSYWKKIFDEMNAPDNIIKSAMDRIDKLLDNEDEYAPYDYRRAYDELGYEFREHGGINFIRKLRAEIIRNRAKEHGIGTIVLHRSKDSDAVANRRDTRGCYHSFGKDIGILHFHNKAEFERIKDELEPFESDIMTPEDWV